MIYLNTILHTTSWKHHNPDSKLSYLFVGIEKNRMFIEIPNAKTKISSVTYYLHYNRKLHRNSNDFTRTLSDHESKRILLSLRG